MPGDIIFVKGGQNVPADCTFLEGDQLSLDKSALTGETVLIKVPGGHDDTARSDTQK